MEYSSQTGIYGTSGSVRNCETRKLYYGLRVNRPTLYFESDILMLIVCSVYSSTVSVILSF